MWVDREKADNTRDRIFRNLAIYSDWIIYMMITGMYSTYFYSETGLWLNTKALDFKYINQWLTKFMKRLSSPRS